MAQAAVLFDVDGTLVRVGGAGREALARGAARAFRIPLEAARAAAAEIDFRGRTDTLLIEELAVRCGAEPNGLDPRVVAPYLAALEETLDECRLELLPGVAHLLEHLERDGLVVGLLTGNVRDAARRKLARFSLAHLVDRPGGFADDGRERAEIARAAAARTGVPPQRTLVIGDTEHDVSAARAAGMLAAAVATGWTALEALAASAPDLLLADLSDPAPLVALLAAL